MDGVTINPKPFVDSLINKKVIVKLKWGSTEYRGLMRSTDGYMNFYLADAEEWKIDGATRVADFKDKLGEILIRCNNVLYVRAAEDDDDELDL